MPTAFRADSAFIAGSLERDVRLVVNDDGTIAPRGTAADQEVVLSGRLLLPGFVNGHSHAFQRAIRGNTEFIAKGHERDDFWSWREAMYGAATALTPEQLYAVSAQAFLEMALAGVTTVGEFHYLHHQSDGTPYDDPGLLAKQVVRAARDVGLRICLLRVAYARAGHEVAPNPRQRRFIDPDVEHCVERSLALQAALRGDPFVSFGLAPHSVRAVPKAWLVELAKFAAAQKLPVHMHVAEQPNEIRACVTEYGLRPVELIGSVGLLGPRFTAVHAIHLERAEVQLLGATGSTVCACPSTERNLGDGIVMADALATAGAAISVGSDSQAHIDLLAEAQMLEGHLRLLRLKRNVLDPGLGQVEGLAAQLVKSLSSAGARSLGVPEVTLAPGSQADFVAVDLQHPSVLGAANPLAGVVMGASAQAITDVVVGGRFVVRDRRHEKAEAIGRDFVRAVQTLSSLT